MAKIMTMFLVLIAIQAALVLYADQSPENTQIWSFIMNMDEWGTLQFILTLLAIAGGIGLVGIIASTVFGFKTDFLIFAPAIGGLILMGVVLTNLGRAIKDDLIANIFTSCDITTGLNCEPVTLIVGLTVGPLALFYVWTIIDFWRGKDF